MTRIDFFLRYDQTLFEDEQKNRMMETKELFDWVLKQPCFEVCYNAPFAMLKFYLLKDSFTFFNSENIFHAVPEQIRYIWKEGSQSKC